MGQKNNKKYINSKKKRVKKIYFSKSFKLPPKFLIKKMKYILQKMKHYFIDIPDTEYRDQGRGNI